MAEGDHHCVGLGLQVARRVGDLAPCNAESLPMYAVSGFDSLSLAASDPESVTVGAVPGLDSKCTAPRHAESTPADSVRAHTPRA